MNTGSVIRRLREERNVTQEYMASKLNIGVTAYGNIERNDIKRLTVDRLKEIADIFKVHVFELFGLAEREVFLANKKKNTDAFSDINMLAVLHYFRKDKEILHASLSILKEICETLRQQVQENSAAIQRLMEMQLEIHQHYQHHLGTA